MCKKDWSKKERTDLYVLFLWFAGAERLRLCAMLYCVQVCGCLPRVRIAERQSARGQNTAGQRTPQSAQQAANAEPSCLRTSSHCRTATRTRRTAKGDKAPANDRTAKAVTKAARHIHEVAFLSEAISDRVYNASSPILIIIWSLSLLKYMMWFFLSLAAGARPWERSDQKKAETARRKQNTAQPAGG